MTDSTNMFGFELLQKVHHDEIHKKEDVIILFIHWYLVKCGFRCIGIGDEVSPDLNILQYIVTFCNNTEILFLLFFHRSSIFCAMYIFLYV